MKVWLAFAWMLLATVGAHAAPVQLEPFKATYAVTYRGLNAGNIVFELKREAPDTYLYHSTVAPSFLARMLISPRATEMTRFVVTETTVQPLEWKLDDGTDATGKDGALTFDATAQRIRGTVENETVDLPFEPGVQDRLSTQIEVMRELLAGQQPGLIRLVDDERVKEYQYTRVRAEKVKTGAGTFDSVIYESKRKKSKKFTRMWHAPSLGYIPVRAEQVRDGKIETVMQLVDLQGR